MASLLSGQLWDDSMRKQGTALAWFDAALCSRQPQRSELLGLVPAPFQLAQFAIWDMILHNPDFRGAYLERCYSREAKLAQAYFHTCAGVCLQISVIGQLSTLWKSHELICLVLHKIVDSSEAVRDDALQVLQTVTDGVLAKRQDKKRPVRMYCIMLQAQGNVHVRMTYKESSYNQHGGHAGISQHCSSDRATARQSPLVSAGSERQACQ